MDRNGRFHLPFKMINLIYTWNIQVEIDSKHQVGSLVIQEQGFFFFFKQMHKKIEKYSVRRCFKCIFLLSHHALENVLPHYLNRFNDTVSKIMHNKTKH